MYSQQVARAQALQESREFRSKLELKFFRRSLYGLRCPRGYRLPEFSSLCAKNDALAYGDRPARAGLNDVQSFRLGRCRAGGDRD